MPDYLVSFKMEVEAATPQGAAAFVDDQFLQPCENGHWIYEVTDLETGTTTVEDGEYS